MTKKQSSNYLLDSTVLNYYPTPVLSSHVFKNLSLKAFRLYHFLLHRMQQRRSWTVELTADILLEGAGVFPQDLAKTRNELKRHGLISSRKVGVGRIEYRLLNPADCTPVQYLRDYCGSLSREQLLRYFKSRFDGLSIRGELIETDNGLRLTRCKWCDRRNVMNIELPKGDASGSGRWRCSGCEERGLRPSSGAIAEFEERLLLANPFWQTVNLDALRRKAHRNIAGLLQSKGAEEDEQERDSEPSEAYLEHWQNEVNHLEPGSESLQE